jgi:flagellar hook-basal body complex protein FliE
LCEITICHLKGGSFFRQQQQTGLKLINERQTMKNKPLILAALVIATLLTGCKQSNPANQNPAASDTNSLSVTRQLQNIKEDVTNAWQKARETTTDALAGVKDETTNVWAHTTEATVNAWTDIKDSMQTTRDYTYDRKDEFVASASADLDVLDRKIKELSDNVATASDSVKAGAQTKLQDLRDKRAALDKKLDAVKNSTEADWNDVKNGFDNSYDDLKNSLKQTWQSISDKVSQ